MTRRRFRASATLLPALLAAAPLSALPTMVRLGYPNCASCHIAPQGGGLLNAYGKGMDEAQSLRAGEYRPSGNPLVKALGWGGRITQDFRSVTLEQLSGGAGQPVLGLTRGRIMYRNATELGKGFRLSTVISAENKSAPRPALRYDLPVRPRAAYVGSALVSYRRGSHLEFSAGRDPLPNGINIPDQGLFVRSRNRMGYYDNPTQLKMFWWGKRYHINPYAFGPSGTEQRGQAESGGGGLAEFDLLGKGTTVVGMNLLHSRARFGRRTLIAPYVRLGFGKWGILAEHDITTRSAIQPAASRFRQSASLAQLFWAPREWLVAYFTGERLGVERPYREELAAGKFELVARLASQVTVAIGARVQRNRLTGRYSQSVALQLAMKTVN